jgi:hypothetical protein
MARGTPANLALGPGYLYLAALGTAEPVDLVATWASVAAAWAGIGYTDAGSTFNYQLNTTPVPVAEELDPISNAPDGRTASVDFAMAEITATNLKRAFNGGTITGATGCVYFEPPDLGTEQRVMLGFESEDHTERWIFRQCFNAGQIAMPRQKGSAKSVIPVSFLLEKPLTGARLFRAIMAAPQRQ